MTRIFLETQTDLLPALGSLLKWLVESAAAATSAPVDISEGSQSTELAPSPVLGYMAQLALSSMQCIVEALDGECVFLKDGRTVCSRS